MPDRLLHASPWRRYLVATVVVVAALIIRMLLTSVLGTSVPYLQFFPAIMVAAWLGGLGAGLLGTAISATLSAYFFLEPIHDFRVTQTADQVSLPLFVGVGIAIAWLTASLQRALRNQRAMLRAAQEREQAAREAAARLRDATGELVRTRKRIADVVANVPGVVWEAWGRPDAASQRIDFVSDYVEPMLGYSPAEWTATPNFWLTLVHPDDRARAAEESRAVFERGTGGTIEFRWVARDGTVMWVESRSHVILDANGRPAGMCGVTMDITERKRLERERAELLAQAQALNRVKDEFLATLSHELRTPLNAILGYARMLRTGTLPEEKRAGAVEVIERNANIQNQLVEDILDVARITTGKVRLNLQTVLLADPLREAVESVRPTAEAKGVRLIVTTGGADGMVSADPGRLQQVFWNLLTNAIKFTPAGGTVTITVGGDDRTLEVAVADTGVGIAADFLPFVFEPFRQADGRSSREHGGLGLGLAISKDLVELHGGEIAVASDGSGAGSTFRVRVPRRRARAEAGAEQDRVPGLPRRAPAPDRGALDGLRVLVVDDEPDSLGLFQVALEHAGATVIGVTSAADALMEMERSAADVLVTDLAMPHVDGFELLRRVRDTQAARGERAVPAIAVTAYARFDDRERSRAAGFRAHVAKPIDPESLVRQIASVVADDERPAAFDFGE